MNKKKTDLTDLILGIIAIIIVLFMFNILYGRLKLNFDIGYKNSDTIYNYTKIEYHKNKKICLFLGGIEKNNGFSYSCIFSDTGSLDIKEVYFSDLKYLK